MKKFLAEFKEFAVKGNMMDMAVGVIVGGAFGALVTALIDNILMPIISLVTGGIDFSNWFVALDGSKYATLAEAQEAGAATLNYGLFISAIINFIILALVVFSIVKAMNKLRKPEAPAEPEAPTTKTCPYCQSEIAIAATRCPHCTSELEVYVEAEE
ncbi:MAG: large conductance mechanosensitive channel protein MscL [Lachnospiraceae bacterium]|nr:large conductance mechanosensitive channel protein MscL [Lachnospiraceae bacterium]